MGKRRPASAARLALLWLALLAATLGPALPAPAQQAAPEREPLFTGEDALWAGGFLLGAVAIAPLDIHLARRIQDSIPQANRVYRAGERALYYLGFPGSLAISASMYGAGRLLGEPGVAEVGLRTTEAIVAATLVTGATKALVGRARPFLEPDDPFNLGFLRGLTEDRYQSFPSGHTAVSFAAASALTTEVGYRAPELKPLAGTLLYGTAALVGVSRMYRNAHWASDVIIGAAIGSFAGWKVVRWHRTHPGNRLDEALLDRGGGEGVPVVLVWRVPV